MNLNEKGKNVPYCLGQLFSVLEAIQQSANFGINATIHDKYFGAASTKPSSAFPKLVYLTQKHLCKLETGLRIHYEKELCEIFANLQQEYPAKLTQPQQGAFQIGYFHMLRTRHRRVS